MKYTTIKDESQITIRAGRDALARMTREIESEKSFLAMVSREYHESMRAYREEDVYDGELRLACLEAGASAAEREIAELKKKIAELESALKGGEK